MQFTVTVPGISMYNQTKKERKGMQNISRDKLKHLDLEYSTDFSNINYQFEQSYQYLKSSQ